MSKDFEPTITAFLCNWCTFTAADLAGKAVCRRALCAETGLDAAEEIARGELGMVRRGETLFHVAEPEDAAARDGTGR